MTIRQRTMCEDNNFANQSFRGSPDRVGSARTGDIMFNSRGYPTDKVQCGSSGEMNEQLKTKDEEIKILWNVIKEINKSKGNEKVSMEQLQQVIISSKGSNSHY